MAPSTGGTATPSRFSVAISTGPASRIVSRSVQKTPPHTRATIPITTSTRPTPCLIDTFSSANKPQQEVCLCWPATEPYVGCLASELPPSQPCSDTYRQTHRRERNERPAGRHCHQHQS